MTNEKPVCSACGSEDVTKDAWAEWDIEKQDWVLQNVYDDTFCQTCEESQKVNWLPVKPAPPIPMNIISGDFPFTEIRANDGNYFVSWEAAQNAGYRDDHIWSITETDGTFCYGPPHHYINLIGHIATAERHDGNTYYEEQEKS